MTSRMIDNVMAAHFILVASITAVLTAFFAIAGSVLGAYSLNPLTMADAAILFGLGYGVYIKKSRTCAMILLACHLGVRLDMYQRTGSLYAAFGLVPMSIAWVYFLGILGTLAFHANKKELGSTASDSPVEPVVKPHLSPNPGS